MPYIDDSGRVRLHPIENELIENGGPKNAGELNYMFSLLINQYMKEHFNYQGMNDVIGALEGAKLEFYRRVVGPYENKKIEKNGDVFDFADEKR